MTAIAHPDATPAPPRAAAQHFALLFIFFLSGVCGLGYQLVWTRSFTVGLGHEAPGMLAVIAAFFVGLAAGAWMLDRPIARSPRPARWYAALEALIGLWAIATIWLIPALNSALPAWIGPEPSAARHWLIAFIVPALALLPATFAMGATLPAMDRALAPLRAGSVVAGLYAANTAGAMVGVVAATTLLLPIAGLSTTLYIFAALNLVCVAATLAVAPRASPPLLLRQSRPDPHPPSRWEGGGGGTPEPPAPAQPPQHATPNLPRLHLALVLTGLLGIGFEVLAIRVMARALENTVYSFAAGLTIYLLGTALGAAAHQRWLRNADPARLLLTLLILLATSIALSVGILSAAHDILARAEAITGPGLAGAVSAELFLALAVFLLPTFLMGLTFTTLARVSRRATGGLGRAIALNTLAGALAPALFGVLLLPAIGAKAALLALVPAYLLCLPRWSGRTLLASLVPIALAALMLPLDLRLVRPPEGGRVAETREGILGITSIVTDAQGTSFLKVNDAFFMGSTIGTFAERRMAHLPLLFHPNPQNALFLGVGTGITLGGAAAHPGLRAEGVELVPEVIDLLPRFEAQSGLAMRADQLRVLAADARRVVASAPRMYDIIVADLFHPHQDGAASLFTVEHFRAIRARLAPDGVACQWLPLHQLDIDTLRIIIRSFLHVFPDAAAFMASYNTETPLIALIAGAPFPLPGTWWADRVRDPGLAGTLAPLALRDSKSLMGGFIAGPAALRAFAADGPLNTDDHPRVLFSAPRFAYASPQPPSARLFALLEALPPDPDAAIRAADDSAGTLRADFGAYLRARNLYLRGMADERFGSRAAAIDWFLKSLAESPEFPTARAMLSSLARELDTTDPAAAAELRRRADEAVAGRR